MNYLLPGEVILEELSKIKDDNNNFDIETQINLNLKIFKENLKLIVVKLGFLKS